jgi:cytochrome d ubiquinol oxidase subunit I
VLWNSRTFLQFLHMWLGAFMVVGFVVAAVYAAGLLRGRDDRHHRSGFVVPFAFATAAAVVQPFAGHLLGGRLYEDQPAKLAAIEMAAETEERAPLVIGGVFRDGEVVGGVEIPGLGSLISRGGVDREVPGLNDFPADERPKDGLVTMVHWAFQGMVGLSLALLALGAVFWWSRRRRSDLLTRRWFLRAAVLAGPAAVLALELGWIVTEVGRQPWIAQGLMRVADAVTGSDVVWITLGVLVVVYIAMGWATVVVLRSMAARWRAGEPADLPTPYDTSDRAGVTL